MQLSSDRPSYSACYTDLVNTKEMHMAVISTSNGQGQRAHLLMLRKRCIVQWSLPVTVLCIDISAPAYQQVQGLHGRRVCISFLTTSPGSPSIYHIFHLQSPSGQQGAVAVSGVAWVAAQLALPLLTRCALTTGCNSLCSMLRVSNATCIDPLSAAQCRAVFLIPLVNVRSIVQQECQCRHIILAG